VKKLAPLVAVFIIAMSLPLAMVWFATSGHGAAHAVISDPLRVDPGTTDLDTWRWADYTHRIVRMPIEAAIDRYVTTSATATSSTAPAGAAPAPSR
jgi:hypothetical protein